MDTIVVDCETTGLDHYLHIAVEIAWCNVTTGDRASFVPRHGSLELQGADPEALELNGYRTRIAKLDQDRDCTMLHRFWDVCLNNRVVIANPAFDTAFLRDTFDRLQVPSDATMNVNNYKMRQPWHYRVLDVESYAAGVLGLDPEELPGMRRLCEQLRVPLGDHTAAGDVEAVVACLRVLQRVRRSQVRPTVETLAAREGTRLPSPSGPRHRA